MKKKTILIILGVCISSVNIFGQNEIPLRDDNTEGNKECPSIDTVVTASYDNETLTIKSKKTYHQ